MKERAESEKVSPTAYATGYFWYRHGLSHEGLVIPEGRKLDRRFRLLIGVIRRLTGLSIEALMLARHKGIDARLAHHIETGAVTQVIELAAGLSPRGWRFTQKYGERLNYIETDLPHMAQRKQALLEKGLFGPRHRVEIVDVLQESGPNSLDELAGSLDPSQGLAIVTEGLLSYLDPATAKVVWARIAQTLKHFPQGVYLSDAYVRKDRYGLGGAMFRGVIQRFVKGRMHVHFSTLADAGDILRECGFNDVALHDPGNIPETAQYADQAGGSRVRILEARK